MIANVVLQVLKTSMFTSLLIGLLLLLVPLLQKRYRAKWRYIAWIIIAVRLLIPVNLSFPQTPINIELPEQAAAVIYLSATNAPPQEKNRFEQDMADTAISEVIPASPTVPKISLPPLQIVGILWLAGVLAFLLFQVCSYQIFIRKLKLSHTEDIPAFIQETIWRIGVDRGICRLPEPIVTDVIDAPVLIGVIHPRVLLPHIQYTDEEISFILRHELVHYRRRDMWYKLALLLANAMHWFNPLVYLLTIQAAKDIELVCDDDVARGLDRDARARYGDTILSALPVKRRLEPLFSTHFGSTKKNMKDRLRNLFDMAAKRRGIMALCAVIICALTITSFVTFGYAAAKPDPVSTVDEKNFSIQRLGQHSLKNGDTLKTNLSWTGKGTVMLLYTNRDYNDDEILVPLQGISGLPKPNYDNIDRNKPQDGSFNFTSSPASPLAQEQKVTESGSYYIYIIRYGFDGISLLTGDVNRVDADGDMYGIWGSQSETAKDTSDEITMLTGSNNVTVKSIGAGEVTCIGKVELGPDSAYTATVSTQSGSGTMIALHNSSNMTKSAGIGWSQHYGNAIGSNIYFSSEQHKTAYIYVGSMPNGTKLTNVTVSLVQTKSPITPNGNPYFQIKSNEKSILHSGSFEAKLGQTLTITTTSNIKGGTVDFFLFSPSGKEQRFTFDGSTGMSKSGEITVPLSAGTWAYNCTGFFDSGNIVITGTLIDAVSADVHSSQSSESDTKKYDAEGIRIMEDSGTWGDSINRLLPYMSPGGVEKVVDIYLERHLFPNITPPEAARQVDSIVEPALKYMTKEAAEAVNNKIAAYY